MKIVYAIYEPERRKYGIVRKKVDYLKLLKASILSIRHFSNEHEIILITHQSGASKKLLNLADKMNIKVIYVEDEFIEFCKKLYNNWNKQDCWDLTIGAYFRFYAFFNYDEFLYLDPDTIIFSDLSKLNNFRGKKVYIRYDPASLPEVKINSGVILQRKKWINKEEILNHIDTNSGKTHSKLDQGLIQDILNRKIIEDKSLLGYLPPEFNFREKFYFGGTIVRDKIENGIKIPVGKDKENNEEEIEILHHTISNNNQFKKNIYCQQFLK